ncbi:MAG: 50S ribosomal protein L25 [Candidatus Pacebacteria bacterium]|nr:50S ribosomal protein L25 [Candidatus Paceibacterota bacterium]
MISLKATIRDRKINTEALRKQDILPAVLYGEGIESVPISVILKDFQEVFAAAGESSLVSLEVGDKKYDVLIHQTERDPLSGRFIHIDFYHPSARKKVEAEIPLVFTGESPAVKDFGGVLIKEIQALDVKGLASKLPREIMVDISSLIDFDARVLVGDLTLPEGVEARRAADEIVALAVLPKEEKPEAGPVAEPAAPEEPASQDKE